METTSVNNRGGKYVEVDFSTNHEGAEAGNERGDYGLWMLVECKKHAAKNRATRSHPLKSNSKQILALNAKNLGQLRRLTQKAKPPTRPPTVSPDGKRKSKRFDYTGLTKPTCSISQDLTTIVTAHFALPKGNHRSSRLKKNDTLGFNTLQKATSLRTEAPMHTQKIFSKSNSKPGGTSTSHGRHHTKAMGNKPTRENHAAVLISHSADPSIPHNDLGVVRPGKVASMEPHLSPHSSEPKSRVPSADRPGMARTGLPLVEIPNRHPNNGRKEDNRVESTIANFTRMSFTHIKHFGRGPNNENHGRRANSNKFNGVFGSNKVDSDMWELPANKPVDQLEGIAFENFGACDMHLEEHGDIEV